MAENQSFTGDHLRPTTATTFSQLLFSPHPDDDDDDDVDVDVDVDKNHHQIFDYSVSSSSSSSSFAIDNPPKMLCFGSKEEDQQHPQLGFKSRQRSAHACSDFSSNSSGNGLKFEFKLKRRNGSNPETAVIKEASKKTKPEAPCSTGHAKRKEKLGERITALQQLVSPFGKTDTASVLHEAMGYIKFLHEQVQVLCSPYLQKSPLLSSQSATGRENGETEGDLKSRGLCLIPVDCSLHLANCTVADFWSPAHGYGKKF